jgi:hypothetical protein
LDFALDRFTEPYAVTGDITDWFQFKDDYVAFVTRYTDAVGLGLKIFVIPAEKATSLTKRKRASALLKHNIGGVILRLMPDDHNFRITSSILMPTKRKQGIMRDLYVAMVYYFGTLYSDEVISESADRLWRSLERSSRVEVIDTGSRYQALCKE